MFEKAKQQGKVRFLGISAHNPKVFRRVLNEYPQFSVIIFPYLFLTKEFGGDSLLKLAQEKQVGVIGLKPFGAGTTFGLKPQQIQGKVDRRAASLVKEMLQEQRISAIIPGVNTPEQLDVNVEGAYEKEPAEDTGGRSGTARVPAELLRQPDPGLPLAASMGAGLMQPTGYRVAGGFVCRCDIRAVRSVTQASASQDEGPPQTTPAAAAESVADRSKRRSRTNDRSAER